MRKSPIVLGVAGLALVGALTFGRVSPQGYGTNHPLCHWDEGTKQYSFLHLSIPGRDSHLANHPNDFIPTGDTCVTQGTTTTVAETTTTAVITEVTTTTSIPVETTSPQESTTTVGSTVPTSVPAIAESGTIPATR